MRIVTISVHRDIPELVHNIGTGPYPSFNSAVSLTQRMGIPGTTGVVQCLEQVLMDMNHAGPSTLPDPPTASTLEWSPSPSTSSSCSFFNEEQWLTLNQARQVLSEDILVRDLQDALE